MATPTQVTNRIVLAIAVGAFLVAAAVVLRALQTRETIPQSAWGLLSLDLTLAVTRIYTRIRNGKGSHE